jgi:hypothetical protein
MHHKDCLRRDVDAKSDLDQTRYARRSSKPPEEMLVNRERGRKGAKLGRLSGWLRSFPRSQKS